MIQASLTVQIGGMGLRRACVLASSTVSFGFTAVAATVELQNETLPRKFHQLSDQCMKEALKILSKMANIHKPVKPADEIQEVWDTAITSATNSILLTGSGLDTNPA